MTVFSFDPVVPWELIGPRSAEFRDVHIASAVVRVLSVALSQVLLYDSINNIFPLLIVLLYNCVLYLIPAHQPLVDPNYSLLASLYHLSLNLHVYWRVLQPR